jgi:hypothetical protein
MRRGLVAFATDVNRYCPLATVVIATAVCLPSIRLALSGKLAMESMLERYVLSLILALYAVRFLAKLIVRYAVSNVLDAERKPQVSETVKPTPRGAVRQP